MDEVEDEIVCGECGHFQGEHKGALGCFATLYYGEDKRNGEKCSCMMFSGADEATPAHERPRDSDRPCENEHPELEKLCGALRSLGVPCDGFTPAADAICALRAAQGRVEELAAFVARLDTRERGPHIPSGDEKKCLRCGQDISHHPKSEVCLGRVG